MAVEGGETPTTGKGGPLKPNTSALPHGKIIIQHMYSACNSVVIIAVLLGACSG